MANTTGKKFGGRGKGTTNKVGSRAKDMLAAFIDGTAMQFQDWVKTVAKTDPHKACDIYLKALEYNLPKLARTDVQHLDENGKPTKAGFDITIKSVSANESKKSN
jgi:hypothetical protein